MLSLFPTSSKSHKLPFKNQLLELRSILTNSVKHPYYGWNDKALRELIDEILSLEFKTDCDGMEYFASRALPLLPHTHRMLYRHIKQAETEAEKRELFQEWKQHQNVQMACTSRYHALNPKH